MNDFALKKDQVYEALRAKVVSGEYAVGMKFPAELEFARELGVGKVTLRAALERLEAEGFLVRAHGRGTFVRGRAARQSILVITHEFERVANPSIHILYGVKEQADTSGVETIVTDRQFVEAMTAPGLAEFCAKENILGIIPLMSIFRGDEAILGILRGCGRPVVLPHAYPDDHRITGFATVCVPENRGWKLAVEHLAGLGHRDIATIIHDTAPDIRGYDLAGFRALLRVSGVSDSVELIAFLPYDCGCVEQAVRTFMAMRPRPSAVLCYSDYFALYVYEALKKLSLDMPEDVAVMGTCGYPGGAFLSPPLSTVDYQYKKLGRLGVETLLGAQASWFGSAATSPVPELFLDATLVVRGSAGSKWPKLEREKQYA